MQQLINESLYQYQKSARQWILRKLQPCQRMVPLMSESMERRLGVAEYLKLRLHLIVCAWCTRYLKQIRFMRRGLRLRSSMDQNKSEPALSLTPEAHQRIAKKLNC
jgi:hypothetical protein